MKCSPIPIYIIILTLTAVRAARADDSLRIEMQNAKPYLRWSNSIGQTYQFTWSDSPNSPRPNAAVTVTADAAEMRWLDETATNASRFYSWQITNGAPATNQLQAALNQIRQQAHTPGAAALVITTNGSWFGTSGLSETNLHSQIEPQMRFSLGSLSKSFAAATVLQLADEGRLSLDNSLSNWLPTIRFVTNTITLRQLLNHTSGVFDFSTSSQWGAATVANPSRRWTIAQVYTYLQAPYFQPGQGYHYSNTGYLLLGQVIEAVTGNSALAEYHRRFIDPLGLAGIYMEAYESSTGGYAHPYSTFNSTGIYGDISNIPRTAFYSQMWTAAAMVSPIETTARWFRQLWGGGVLSTASFREMTTWTPQSTNYYGMAVWTQPTSKGRFYAHGGHAPGYWTYVGHSPSLQTTVLLFFNSDLGTSDIAIQPYWLQLVDALP